MRRARLVVLAILATLAVPAGAAVASHPVEQPEWPRCFGAASRDPAQPCRNPSLKGMVRPKPLDAQLEPNSDCTPFGKSGELFPCAFGVPEDMATETIALIGDSHAAHWRAAIDVIMDAKHWRGISMTKAGCPLSTAVSKLPQPGQRKCIRWKRELFRWFDRHPEVTTVITSNHTGGQVVGAGDRDYSAHVKGYAEALRRLPPTVERIISIRDVPRNSQNSMNCVRRAIKTRKNAGPVCAVPRRFALKRDPATVAARRLSASRVQLVDLSRFMCSSRLCLPVIGGALVHKDQTHLTRVFARTLGPYLMRYVDRALAYMAAGKRA